MAESLELVHLESFGTAFVIRINGRWGPGVPSTHDWLDGEIEVRTSFVSGAVPIILVPQDLDAWERVIDRLAAEENTSWLTESGRTPEVWFECRELPPVLIVKVDDPNSSRASAEVVVDVADGWVDDLRLRLDRVRSVYPREAKESSPGVWVWDRGRT